MKYFLLLIIFTCTNSTAQVYTWVNQDGVKVYGDEPPTHATKAELPTLQTITIKKPAATTDNQAGLEKKELIKEAFSYKSLNIITPKQDEMILAGKAGKASVQIQLTPPLQANHEIRLLMDGIVVAQGAQLYFEIDNIFRGSHLLQAQIKHQGTLLISSTKRRIHVQRPSILNR